VNVKSARLDPAGNRSAAVDAFGGQLEAVFDGLAQLAAISCASQWAAIVIHASGSTWCTAAGRAAPDAIRASEPFSHCVGDAADFLEIEDASDDARFRGAACVTGPPGIRSYAGIALRDADGNPLGTMSVYDTAARRLTAEQRSALRLIAAQCQSQVELRAHLTEHLVVSAGDVPRADTDSHSALACNLLEHAPVAIYHTDGAGHSQYVNPAYRRIFGLAPGQGDDDWIQAVHPGDRARLQDAWSDFRARPRPVRFEYRTDPERYGARVLAEQVVPAAGADGFVGTITDVTDLIAVRDELRKLETLFRHSFEQAPIGIAYSDRDGRLLRFNPAFAELLRGAPADLERLTMEDLTYAEDVVATRAKLATLWQRDVEFVDVEKRYRRFDGSLLWVRTTTALICDAYGEPQCSVEFVRDISVRKRMEADLLENQTLLEAVIANLPVALLASDATGRVTRYNDAAADLFAIIDRAPAEPAPPDSHPLQGEVYLADGVTPVAAEQRPLARALRGEVIRDLELVIVPDGSSPRTTLTNARRLTGPDGATLGAVTVMQDITAEKLADLALERVHRQLMSASRQAGMAEVATNVLHNVGNILNSINISASRVAERLKQSKAPGLRRVAALLQEQGDQAGAFLANDDRGRQIPDYLASLGA